MMRLRAVRLPVFLLLFIIGGPTQAGFVTMRDGSFWEDDRRFRFVGFNLRGLCHYGYYDALPAAHSADRAINLDAVVACGGRVVRVFCAYRGIGRTATGDRLQLALDMAAQRGLYLLVCLTDFYNDTKMNPQGDEVYYVNAGGYSILGDAFFTGGYRNNYLPQAAYLAQRFRDHPGLFAWEVGNELRNDWNKPAFIAFCHDVAATIRATDPNHMITTGIAGTNVLGMSTQQKMQLYGPFDFLTTHNYNGLDSENDAWLAAALIKPYIIEEAGMSSGDRPARTDTDLVKWSGRGASGYLQWGLMATTYDNGDGDRLFGMDRVFHNDWQAYVNVYRRWADTFAGATPTPTRSPTPSPTVTPTRAPILQPPFLLLH